MVTIIVQARMGSTRLPGKVLMSLCGKPIIEHIVERLRQCDSVGGLIIATSTKAADGDVEAACADIGVECFRGSDEDVLKRYYDCSVLHKCKHIVRICADNPLLDPRLIDMAVQSYLRGRYDYVGLSGAPIGLGAEVFPFERLEDAYYNADKPYQREHVTQYIIENTENIFYSETGKDYSKYRFTLDTPEDWEFIKEIYKRAYHGQHDFYLEDIVSILEHEPELMRINSHIKQRRPK